MEIGESCLGCLFLNRYVRLREPCGHENHQVRRQRMSAIVGGHDDPPRVLGSQDGKKMRQKRGRKKKKKKKRAFLSTLAISNHLYRQLVSNKREKVLPQVAIWHETKHALSRLPQEREHSLLCFLVLKHNGKWHHCRFLAQLYSVGIVWHQVEAGEYLCPGGNHLCQSSRHQ